MADRRILGGALLSKGVVSFSVSELASRMKGGSKPGGPRPALSVTAQWPCWVWVKRTGEQACFSDLKHLGWATLVKASGGEGSSSSLAAITIQLTFMLSLRTWAKRAALLPHPQSPAKVYISWIVNSWMFSKLPPPAMKEGINGANSHPPPCCSGQRGAVGDFQTAARLLPSQAGTATLKPDQTQQQHLQDHRVTSNRTGQHTRNNH